MNLTCLGTGIPIGTVTSMILQLVGLCEAGHGPHARVWTDRLASVAVVRANDCRRYPVLGPFGLEYEERAYAFRHPGHVERTCREEGSSSQRIHAIDSPWLPLSSGASRLQRCAPRRAPANISPHLMGSDLPELHRRCGLLAPPAGGAPRRDQLPVACRRFRCRIEQHRRPADSSVQAREQANVMSMLL